MIGGGRKGAARRRQYTAVEKMEVISDYEACLAEKGEPGEAAKIVALRHTVDRSLVIKWVKAKTKIANAAEVKYKSIHSKIRPSRKYQEVYRELLKTFKEAHRKGFRVNFQWLLSKARVIYRKQMDNPEATLLNHVIVTAS